MGIFLISKTIKMLQLIISVYLHVYVLEGGKETVQ
jgi:hypothetical protein